MTAHRIATDDEAISVAGSLSAQFAVDAAARDQERRFGVEQLDELSASGLLGATVPSALGGADVSFAALTEVFRLLGEADARIAQIPQSHFVFLDVLRRQGTRTSRPCTSPRRSRASDSRMPRPSAAPAPSPRTTPR